MPGTLYVVATPIGNLEDITFRAVRVLREVALVAAEDTRRTGQLLRHYGIETPLVSFHEHNANARAPGILERLAAGDDVAVVSDAGTPAISDPGTELVARCHGAGIRVVPIPGASAVAAAAAASGFPLVPFTFLGFPPHKAKDREHWFEALAQIPHTVVAFEAPHRIHSFLQASSTHLGNRQIVVARELTKVHEELVIVSAAKACDLEPPQRGEFTLVIAPAERVTVASTDEEVLADLLQMPEGKGLGPRELAAAVARRHGRSTQDVYRILLRHRRNAEER